MFSLCFFEASLVSFTETLYSNKRIAKSSYTEIVFDYANKETERERRTSALLLNFQFKQIGLFKLVYHISRVFSILKRGDQYYLLRQIILLRRCTRSSFNITDTRVYDYFRQLRIKIVHRLTSGWVTRNNFILTVNSSKLVHFLLLSVTCPN